ncbi:MULTISPECIES: hypothetical protein [Streptomyces]|uniref:Uncharacterized protein n=2 Tax=Streptomyces TaxID=1883 RepID=A0ABV9J768_9ACTN
MRRARTHLTTAPLRPASTTAHRRLIRTFVVAAGTRDLTTSFASVCTSSAAGFTPGRLVRCRSAAWTAIETSRSGRTA